MLTKVGQSGLLVHFTDQVFRHMPKLDQSSQHRSQVMVQELSQVYLDVSLKVLEVSS